MQTQQTLISSGGPARLALARHLPRPLLFLAAGAVLLQNTLGLAVETNPSTLPSIFVAPLHGDSRVGLWQPAVGDGLAEMLITELTKLEKFRVLESTTLDSIKDEIKMGDDGWIAPGEKVEKGNWKGADYMFVGKITRFANKSKSFGGGSGWGPFRAPIPVPVHGFDVTTTEAEVDIDWRVVDAASRDIIKSGRGQGRESGTSWGFRGGLGSGFVRQHEFLDSALGKATVKAIDQIVAQVSQTSIGPGTRARLQQAKADAEAANQQAVQDALRATPGEVRAVTPQFVIVSLGANHGLNPGDKLDLYEVNEVHNKKGEVVMRDEKRVGEVVVESVQAETSKARYDGAMKPEEGWVVRVAGAITAAAAKR